MQKILVPVDGSDASLRALEAAIQLANSTSATELHVITVQIPITSRNVSRFFDSSVLNEYYQEEGVHVLASAAELLGKSGIETIHQEVLVGSVAETIAEYISKHGCTHLVMGTRGLGAVPGLILGSVTTRVIGLASVPITLIK